MPTETGTAAANALATDARNEALARQAARESYVALLIADSGQQADIDALAEAARTIGKTHVELRADYNAVKEAKALVARAQSLAGCRFARDFIIAFGEKNYTLHEAEKLRLEKQDLQLRLTVASMAAAKCKDFEVTLKRLAALREQGFGDLLKSIQTPPESVADQNVTPETIIPEFAEWLAARVAVKPAAIASSASPFPPPI